MSNKPVDDKLWQRILDLARGESSSPVDKNGKTVNPVNGGEGFKTWPSAYAVGWALAQYKRLGGKWKKESSAERVAAKKLKNEGHGGLDEWFSGHGGGDPEERATWGDWVAITPVKHTVKKEDGEDKTYEPGDIVGPCGISSEDEWADITGEGSKPLKCMPREKAWDLTRDERATLARRKRREEKKHRGQKPVNTPTFSEEAKGMLDKKAYWKHADFFREVVPPDSLSSLSNGSDTGKDTDPVGKSHSALPNGDSARNIGRPSPDSPNLKYRNLDRSEAYGRTPANKLDTGYVHDSGSGSARVIPYDSGFANNSSALRNAGWDRPASVDSLYSSYRETRRIKMATRASETEVRSALVSIYKSLGNQWVPSVSFSIDPVRHSKAIAWMRENGIIEGGPTEFYLTFNKVQFGMFFMHPEKYAIFSILKTSGIISGESVGYPTTLGEDYFISPRALKWYEDAHIIRKNNSDTGIFWTLTSKGVSYLKVLGKHFKLAWMV